MARCLILFSAFLLLTACKNDVDKTLEQVVEQTYRLDAGGSLRIRNKDGAIHLFGSNAPELRVKAIKRAYSMARLQAIDVRISSQPQSAVIDTIFPPAKKWSLRDRSGTVDYIIVMPERLKVDLELVNGEITVDGLREGSGRARVKNGRLSALNSFASLNYQAANGAIDFYYYWWESTQFLVKATIPNGNIGVTLPRDASFRVEAETRGGSVACDQLDGDDGLHSHRKKLTSNIGSGKGAMFQLQSGSGNVRIRAY